MINCQFKNFSDKTLSGCTSFVFLGDVTTYKNNSILCHAKQGAKVSTATAAPAPAVVTSLPPTLSHLCGHNAIAKIREIVIAPGINHGCGFTNQRVKVNIATITLTATMKLQSNHAKLSLNVSDKSMNGCTCLLW
jgi:hypothetical protein